MLDNLPADHDTSRGGGGGGGGHAMKPCDRPAASKAARDSDSTSKGTGSGETVTETTGTELPQSPPRHRLWGPM